MTYTTLGALLAQYVLTRGIGEDAKAYTTSLWKDITALLDKFVASLDHENLDQYAANCLNAGYWSESRGVTLMAKTVADRLMCTLMTGAVFFMNGPRTQSGGSQTNDTHNEALKEHIRCAIVNIFMYILLESPCKSRMGVNYAWYTMKQLEEGAPGLITTGNCQRGVFADIQIKDFNMEQMIKAWLKRHPSLTDKFAGKRIESICTKRLAELDGATQDGQAMPDNTDLRPEEKTVIQKLGQKLKNIVEEVKTGVMQCALDPGACMQSIEAVTGRNREGDDSEGKATKSVASDKPAPNGAEGEDPGEKEIIRPDTYRIAQYGSRHNKTRLEPHVQAGRK
ncbi:hypothetical protein AK88_05052 [Plasmodium fragile]|uniref:Schizont-infected cell agglutination extracellular alpha domain-containing protein n=1 Tax=Plasmodium fragile TaxID=5857 RepID=A0A0D9QEB1_PLAFR|nr:uncharacterized protein AK88_05052 [Plasmodium fragile]KJP85319.1 hypothetical protein AK88_05052 [Plasmodium fragile]